MAVLRVMCLYLGLCVCPPMCSPVFCRVCAGTTGHSPASPCPHSEASGKLCSLPVAPNFHLASWSSSRPRVGVAAASVWGEAVWASSWGMTGPGFIFPEGLAAVWAGRWRRQVASTRRSSAVAPLAMATGGHAPLCPLPPTVTWD